VRKTFKIQVFWDKTFLRYLSSFRRLKGWLCLQLQVKPFHLNASHHLQ